MVLLVPPSRSSFQIIIAIGITATRLELVFASRDRDPPSLQITFTSIRGNINRKDGYRSLLSRHVRWIVNFTIEFYSFHGPVASRDSFCGLGK